MKLARLLFALSLAACAGWFVGCNDKSKPPSGDEPSIAFSRDGKVVRTLTRSDLERASPPSEVTTADPYYGKTKKFRGVVLRKVLEAAYGPLDKEDREVLLRAKDGYTVPLKLDRVLEDGGYIAIADAEVPAWEPIGPQHANPAPFYLFWSKPEQGNLETHPRPWQLASVELARFDVVFPHTSPGDLPAGAPALAGYKIFREQCIRCHAINREGGHVGPDLNVPQNILEYRPEAQVRAYIKNPMTFRYGNMPAHPQLTDADLDGLVAYFSAMRAKKFDPAGKP